MAELADALDLGSSGRPWGFESLHPHEIRVFETDKSFKNPCFVFDTIIDSNIDSNVKGKCTILDSRGDHYCCKKRNKK